MRPYSGFSLIETSVTVAILGLIGLAVLTFQQDIFGFSNLIGQNLASQQQAKRTLRQITSELRTANQANTGAYVIAAAISTDLTFYSDSDNDGLREKIHYYLDTTTLKKSVVVPTGNPLTYDDNTAVITTAVEYLTNGATPIFSYYSSSYDGASPALPLPVNVLAIRLIKIQLLIDRFPAKPPGPTTITSQISLRNLKDNL